MRSVRKGAKALLLLGLLLSCAKKEVIRPPLPPEAITPELLIEAVSYDHIDTLSSELRVRIYRDEEPFAYLTGVVSYKRPALLASTFLGPLGVTVMKLVVADNSVEILLPGKEVLYTSSMTLSPLLPDAQALAQWPRDVSESEDDYILTLYAGSGETIARYYFAKETLENHTVEKFAGGKLLMRMEISERGPNNVPLKFSIITGQSRFSVVQTNVVVNGEIPEASFTRLSAPKRLPLQDLFRALAPTR